MTTETKPECRYRADLLIKGGRVSLRLLNGKRTVAKAEMPLCSSKDIIRTFETMGTVVAKQYDDRGSVILNADGNLV
jgi:hypothetical protein